MAEQTIPETKDLFRPSRVLISADGEAVAPMRTLVEPDVIFVRHDGWSLGATRDLAEAARRMWAGSWVEKWMRRDDGHWEKVWPLPADGGEQ